jgi:DNA-binding MarR family transcriptional regulator
MTPARARTTKPRPPRAPKDGGRAAAADEADPAVRVLRQFRQIFNAVKKHFQRVERQSGLGGSQVWALAIVRAQPGIGVGDLARAMNIRQSTASNLVKALVGRDLLATSPRPEDRRSVRLKLTAGGSQLLRRVPGPYAGVLPTALRALEAKTLKRLEADLLQLLAHLEVDARSGEIPLADM